MAAWAVCGLLPVAAGRSARAGDERSAGGAKSDCCEGSDCCEICERGWKRASERAVAVVRAASPWMDADVLVLAFLPPFLPSFLPSFLPLPASLLALEAEPPNVKGCGVGLRLMAAASVGKAVCSPES